MVDLSRLKSQLLTSGLSQKNNAEFQVINQLIDAISDANNTIAGLTAQITGLSIPYAEFISTVNQTPGVTTPVQVTFDTQIQLNKINFDAGTNTFTITQNGLYRLLFNGQMGETNNGRVNIDIWFRKNGTDLPFSNFRQFIQANVDNQIMIANYMDRLNVGDQITVFMSVDDATRVAGLIKRAPAGEPVIPSAFFDLDLISP